VEGAVVLACAVTAWLGYLGGVALGAAGTRAAAIGAGGLLAMLTDFLTVPHPPVPAAILAIVTGSTSAPHRDILSTLLE
jgi:hypothetical protein